MWYWRGMGPFGWAIMVAFWVLVVLLIVWAVRWSGQPQDKAAFRILDERLAKGEIDPAEYKERRAVLESRR